MDSRPPTDKQLNYAIYLLQVLQDSQHIDHSKYQELMDSATTLSEISRIISIMKAIVDDIKARDKEAHIW